MRIYSQALPWITPLAALDRVGTAAGTALLQSVRGGRWSILVAQPIRRVHTLAELAQATADFHGSSVWPFAGGAVGMLSYELAHEFEEFPTAGPEFLPRVWFGIYDGALIWDHSLRQFFALGWSAARVRAWQQLLAQRPARRAPISLPTTSQLTSNFTAKQYCSAVREVQEYLRQGRTYQVNLSQRFHLTAPQLDPLTLYARLTQTNPAPFSGYLDAGDFQILSSSPELLFQTDGSSIETGPIAGTRPRGVTPAADRCLAHDLLGSAKERAEHAMLVDLERNDLGRICRFGSVQVLEYARLKKFARVQHLVSRVAGTLAPGVDIAQILRALYPYGTITGCPKVETMRIISRLEGTARGSYTGALGYISTNQKMQFSVLIRTLTYRVPELSFGVGGGVVMDSDPAAEYAETLAKAAALVAALGDEKNLG